MAGSACQPGPVRALEGATLHEASLCFLRQEWTRHVSDASQGGTGLQLPPGLDSAFISLLSTCWVWGWEVSELGETLGQCPGQGELSKDVLNEWECSGAPQRGLDTPEYEPATTQTSLSSLL